MKRNDNHILLTESEVLQAITEYLAKNNPESLRGFTSIYSEPSTLKFKDNVVLNPAPVTVGDIHYNYSLRLDLDEVKYIPRSANTETSPEPEAA